MCRCRLTKPGEGDMGNREAAILGRIQRRSHWECSSVCKENPGESILGEQQGKKIGNSKRNCIHDKHEMVNKFTVIYICISETILQGTEREDTGFHGTARS